MKRNTLKTVGILVLSTVLLAASACGKKETASADVPGTEQAVVTEATESAEPETEATELPEETEEPTETIVPETETEQAAEYTVTDMSATKYAKSSVNVRKGPSSDYEKLGGLSTNQKVTVTGQADTGWYRIEYNGEEGFVSDKYLSDSKVAVNTSGSNASGSSAATGTGNAGTSGTSGSTDTNASGSTGTSGNSGNTSGSNTAAGTDSAGNTSTGDTGASTLSVDTSTPASTPTTDAATDTPATDTPTTSVDASDWSIDDLNAFTGGGTSGLTQGSSDDVGVGGDWIE